MRIGLDIDGVMFDFVGALERHCDSDCVSKECGMEQSHTRWVRLRTPAVRWEFFEDWGWSAERFRLVSSHAVDHADLFLDGQPTPGAVEFVERLHRAGHKIVFVTARDFGRPGESERQTRKWLSLHGFPYDELHFTKDKTGFDLDVLLDDCVDNLTPFWSAEDCDTLPICWDQPWNQEWTGLRASTWEKVEQYIEEADVREEDVADAIKRGEEWQTVNQSTGGKKGMKLARFDLIPTRPLAILAEHYGRGAEKYADRNWERGVDWSKNYAALMRHITAWWGGEDDDEIGSPHLAAVAWHAFSLLEYAQTHPELDDRPADTRAPAT